MTNSTATVISPRSDAAFPQWQPATWEDYLKYRDAPPISVGLSKETEPMEMRLFFDCGYLLVDMGNEGINHSRFNHLFTMLFFAWFASRQPEEHLDVLGGCVLEKPKKQAASPDIVLYIGGDSPQWQEGEPRRINLDEWRVPDLVGEIGDTTLATDLDEKKKLYAGLEIPEYWVVDIKGKRVLAFRLQENGKYRQCNVSEVVAGLPILLLEQTLLRLESDNFAAAIWFSQQVAQI